jgi:hypothetical protein
MKYYIVMNEWNYPTESGRDFVGDYDTREEAVAAAEAEYEKEKDNFFEVTSGGWYNDACGQFNNEDGSIAGFMMHSSQWEDFDIMFRSVIIEREVV